MPVAREPRAGPTTADKPACTDVHHAARTHDRKGSADQREITAAPGWPVFFLDLLGLVHPF